MTCPVCGSSTIVVDTYPTEETVVRRRRCKDVACGYRFTTIECETTEALPSRGTVKKKGEYYGRTKNEETLG